MVDRIWFRLFMDFSFLHRVDGVFFFFFFGPHLLVLHFLVCMSFFSSRSFTGFHFLFLRFNESLS